MRWKMRSLLAAVAILFATRSASHAAMYTTAGASAPSEVVLELYLGASAGYDPDALLAALGPIGVNGSVDADVDLTGGDGTVTFNSANLVLDSFGPTTIVLAGLGTLDATLNGVALNFNSAPLSVTAFNFLIDSSSTGSLSIFDGSALLDNPTGFLAGVLTEPLVVDFSTDPVSVDFSELGDGILPGQIIGSEILLGLDAAIPLTEIIEGSDIFVWGRLTGSFTVTAVPEVGSLSMLAVAGLSATGLTIARRRRRANG